MFAAENLLLYAVTGRMGKQTLLEQIEEALKGGITLLQLREKDLSPDELISEAIQIRRLCHRYNVPLIINDSPEAAFKSGADGVHVGASDSPVAEIRKRAGKAFIIGATAKTPEQAIRAENDGADYLGVGAVFPSPTKKDAIRITPDELKEICGAVSIPCAAIGGIAASNMKLLAGCNISGIAVVSAVFGAENIRRASSDLLGQIKDLIKITERNGGFNENSIVNRRE